MMVILEIEKKKDGAPDGCTWYGPKVQKEERLNEKYIPIVYLQDLMANIESLFERMARVESSLGSHFRRLDMIEGLQKDALTQKYAHVSREQEPYLTLTEEQANILRNWIVCMCPTIIGQTASAKDLILYLSTLHGYP